LGKRHPKRKDGQGKNVSLRMNNGQGKCELQKMMRPWEKMACGMILAQREGDP